MQRMCNQFHSHESHFIHRWSDIHAIWNFHARSKHTWVKENPHCVVQNKYQREFSMNVWLEVLDNKLIGSFFLPVFFCLTREIYLEFLKTVYYNCWKMWVYTWEETCGLCTTNHRSISALMPRNIWTKNIPIGLLIWIHWISVGLLENFGVQNVGVRREYSADANYRQV